MNNNSVVKGHICALITIVIWGTTFISTKILLANFKPVEILFYRFGIGYIALFIAYPRRLKIISKKEELLFAAAGLCGVTLYFLVENIALTYTTASNVGVIVPIAPFFTAMLATRVLSGERPKANFYIGFLIAIAGIILVSFNGSAIFELNPIGDLLALLAAAVWAVYCILTKKISQFGYSTIQTTRRIFFYGLFFIIPALFLFRFNFEIDRFLQPVNTFNILFLGLGASALCFVTWNLAVKIIGAVKTSVYIYAVPIVTVTTAAIVLKEKVTLMLIIGVILTLSGLFLSERKRSLVQGAI